MGCAAIVSIRQTFRKEFLAVEEKSLFAASPLGGRRQFAQNRIAYVHSYLIPPRFLREVQSMVGASENFAKCHFFCPVVSGNTETRREGHLLAVKIAAFVSEIRPQSLDGLNNRFL